MPFAMSADGTNNEAEQFFKLMDELTSGDSYHEVRVAVENIRQRLQERRQNVREAVELLREVREMPSELLERAAPEELVNTIKSLMFACSALEMLLNVTINETESILDTNVSLVNDVELVANMLGKMVRPLRRRLLKDS